MQIFELTYYSHVGLFVDSHPKCTCQTQKISVSCRLHGAEVRERRVAHQRHQMSSERRQKMQIFELTHYSHVALFVDSHPKFTCPKKKISGSHT